MKKIRILLMEDSPNFLDHAMKCFPKENFEVTVVRNGRDGISTYKKGNFDIILSDFNMPFIDGGEACSQIRAKDPNIPIIIWTDNLDQIQKQYPVNKIIDKWENIGKVADMVKELVNLG